MSHSGNQFGLIGRVLGRGSRWRSVLFGLLYEVRNLPRRMAALRKGDIRLGVCSGPLAVWSASKGRLIPCMSTHARNADMQKLFRDHQFLTAVDLPVALNAWEMGFRFGVSQEGERYCDTASSTEAQLPAC